MLISSKQDFLDISSLTSEVSTNNVDLVNEDSEFDLTLEKSLKEILDLEYKKKYLSFLNISSEIISSFYEDIFLTDELIVIKDYSIKKQENYENVINSFQEKNQDFFIPIYEKLDFNEIKSSINSMKSFFREASHIAMHGGGSMRVRLKPDDLGEVWVKISTHGNQVSLDIRANKENAIFAIKNSIEELKELFFLKNLNLYQFDINLIKKDDKNESPLSLFRDNNEDFQERNGYYNKQSRQREKKLFNLKV